MIFGRFVCCVFHHMLNKGKNSCAYFEQSSHLEIKNSQKQTIHKYSQQNLLFTFTGLIYQVFKETHNLQPNKDAEVKIFFFYSLKLQGLLHSRIRHFPISMLEYFIYHKTRRIYSSRLKFDTEVRLVRGAISLMSSIKWML